MKVTSLKNMDSYIYSSVIIPLKSLYAPLPNLESPIKGNSGKGWTLSVRRESVSRRRRNYQTARAARTAKMEIILSNGRADYLIGNYDDKTHKVRLFERPLRRLDALLLLKHLKAVLDRNTPFTKVIVDYNRPNRAPDTSLNQEAEQQEDTRVDYSTLTFVSAEQEIPF